VWTKRAAIQYAKNELDRLKIRRSGGVWVDTSGYIQFRTTCGGKSRRFHRFITKIRMNDQLESLEVHHDDHDKLNNTPENLITLTFHEHRANHSSKAARPDDKRFLWRETRKGEGNPNFGNHRKRVPKPRSEITKMRKNQPGYISIEKDVLRKTINMLRRPSLIQRDLGVTYKVFMNRCKEYGYEYRCTDNGLIPQIP
jgi:hypothetical protein